MTLFHFFSRMFGPRIRLHFVVGGIIITGKNLMARITTDQSIVVSISPKTASGANANIDGDAQFTATGSTGPGTGSFVQLSPTSARFTPTGPGIVQIRVTADADLDGDETRTLTATGALEVVTPEEEATTLEVTFGDPE